MLGSTLEVNLGDRFAPCPSELIFNRKKSTILPS